MLATAPRNARVRTRVVVKDTGSRNKENSPTGAPIIEASQKTPIFAVSPAENTGVNTVARPQATMKPHPMSGRLWRRLPLRARRTVGVVAMSVIGLPPDNIVRQHSCDAMLRPSRESPDFPDQVMFSWGFPIGGKGPRGLWWIRGTPQESRIVDYYQGDHRREP